MQERIEQRNQKQQENKNGTTKPTNSRKMTALLEQFNNQKETLIMIDRELAALHMQQAKNNATIAAVKSEYEQEAAAIKVKFEQSHELALDDYTLIQKAKAELKLALISSRQLEKSWKKKSIKNPSKFYS